MYVCGDAERKRNNGVEIWGKAINRLYALMWLSSCGCSLSAENAEWWFQWERDQWMTQRRERRREGGKVLKKEWRQREWWAGFLCLCVCKCVCMCMHLCCMLKSESESLCITLFSYADQLVLLFTVHKLHCMFIYVNIQCCHITLPSLALMLKGCSWSAFMVVAFNELGERKPTFKSI